MKFLYFPILFSHLRNVATHACRDTRHRHIKKIFSRRFVPALCSPTCKLLRTPLLVSRSMVHVLGSLQSLAGTLSDEGWGPRDDKIVQFSSHYFLYFPIFHLKYSYILSFRIPIFLFFVKKVTGRPVLFIVIKCGLTYFAGGGVVMGRSLSCDG